MKVMRELQDFKDALLARKVAGRFATEFPSEEALKDYLHEHPGADPENHSVKKHEDGGGSKAEAWRSKGSGELKDEADTAMDHAGKLREKARKSNSVEDHAAAAEAYKEAGRAWRDAAAKMDDRIKKAEGSDATNKKALLRFVREYKDNARASETVSREHRDKVNELKRKSKGG